MDEQRRYEDAAEQMILELRNLRARHLEETRVMGLVRRNQVIAALRDRGYALLEIAAVFQMSREHARQIVAQQRTQDEAYAAPL